MRRKQFFETRREANKFLKAYRKQAARHTDHWNVYDLKRVYPRRKKTRFFVGDYFEWLNI